MWCSNTIRLVFKVPGWTIEQKRSAGTTSTWYPARTWQKTKLSSLLQIWYVFFAYPLKGGNIFESKLSLLLNIASLMSFLARRVCSHQARISRLYQLSSSPATAFPSIDALATQISSVFLMRIADCILSSFLRISAELRWYSLQRESVYVEPEFQTNHPTRILHWNWDTFSLWPSIAQPLADLFMSVESILGSSDVATRSLNALPYDWPHHEEWPLTLAPRSSKSSRKS